jgi:hypothetical protein
MTTKSQKPPVRLDAATSYFIDQQLEAQDPRKFRQLVPGIVGRRFIPTVQGLSRSQPTYAYMMQILKAKARKHGGRSKDAPTVAVLTEKVTHSIETYTASIDYEFDDVENARINNLDLPGDKKLAAVTKLEEQIDASLATGDSGVTGILNNANVSSTVAAAKTGGGTTWTGASVTADEMVKDVASAVSATTSALKQARIPGSEMPNFLQWALFLPDSWYVKAATTYRTNTDTSALEMIQRMPFIKSVIPWWRAETADGGAARAALIPALDNGAVNPMAAGAIVPFDYEEQAPQLSGWTVSIPTRGKAGGVAIPYPVGCRYIDLS